MDFVEFFLKVIKTLLIEEITIFFPLIILFFYSFLIIKYKKDLSLFTKALILLLPIIFIFYSYSYLPDYFSSIGQDSLIEVRSDYGEAIFFLKNFFKLMFDPEIFKRNRFWLVLVSSLF